MVDPIGTGTRKGSVRGDCMDLVEFVSGTDQVSCNCNIDQDPFRTGSPCMKYVQYRLRVCSTGMQNKEFPSACTAPLSLYCTYFIQGAAPNGSNIV